MLSKHPGSAGEPTALMGQHDQRIPLQMYMIDHFVTGKRYDPALVWAFIKAYPRALHSANWQYGFVKYRRGCQGDARKRLSAFQGRLAKIRLTRKGIFDGILMNPDVYVAVAGCIDHPSAAVFQNWTKTNEATWNLTDAEAVNILRLTEEETANLRVER